MPKSLENEATKSLTPPPPLPSRTCRSAATPTTEMEDFPPPPAFGDDDTSVVFIVPPPPPPPKPFKMTPSPPSNKMIPPPPPPNSNKIQIFTKSFPSISLPSKNKLFRSDSQLTNSKRPLTTSSKSADLQNTTTSKKEANNTTVTSATALTKKHHTTSSELVFDEELKQKLEKKKQTSSFDETLFENRGRRMVNGVGSHTSNMEAELEAILKKRREKSLSTPPGTRKTTSKLELLELPRKSASFRINLGEAKFSTLPTKRPKPKLPDYKPSFARGDSFKIQSWNRISAGNKCI